MILNNLHWDWENWWRRQRLYFGWTLDMDCAAERGFHYRVPLGWLTPVLFLFLLYMLHDYLTVGHGSAPGVWAVVLGMYVTHLKHR